MAPSEHCSFQKLLTGADFENQRPTQPLRLVQHLRVDCNATFDQSLLCALFLQYLPPRSRTILAANVDLAPETERESSSFLCESSSLSLLPPSHSDRVTRIIPQSNGACSSPMGFPCIAPAGHQPCLATEGRKSRLREERERASRDRTL